MSLTESELLGQAWQQLVALLPTYVELVDVTPRKPSPDTSIDRLWEVRSTDGGRSLVLVTARTSLEPREAERIKAQRKGLGWPTNQKPGSLLVVAPWLSARSRDLLEQEGCSYLDLTGNINFRVERPGVYLRLQGAARNPDPMLRPPVRLSGAKARRLVRLLVDFVPPYRLTDLARAGDLNRGYVSSLLNTLDEQALLERDRKGAVQHVDWPALLVAAAGPYDLLRNNPGTLFVAPAGAADLYRRLDDTAPAVAVTGSFAASAVAPIVAPMQLVAYAEDPSAVRRFGRLLPVDRGADVVLLRPEDPKQVERTRRVIGHTHVGLSQLVLDCLGGNGRLPEEGQAVLEWMRTKENDWRLRGLPEFDG
ncbi:hypothetical protein [Polymorphospora rubra]|uniref:hypothetical protein n=1 Tax=Polymorphospora rubra TaxID=338584 RepID=UPI001BB34949|nr:hypothetical protein [Polymorphospora rubra]